jgi:hypothetical protein
MLANCEAGEKVMEWKQRSCPAYAGKVVTEPDLGYCWFRNFIRRYPEIEIQTQVNVENRRESWCTYHNLKDMYDSLMQHWLELKYIEELPNPEWQDLHGNKVPVDSPNRVGRKVKYRWLHANRFLVADEVGHNTNMSRQLTPRMMRTVGEKGRKCKKPAATDDCHFTCLGFTNLNGDPVLMVCIVKQKDELNFNVTNGVDRSKPWIGDSDVFQRYCEEGIPIPTEDLKRNIGEGKRHPGGVTTVFNGVEVPMFVTNSETGSINSAILVQILKHIDALNLFPRDVDVPSPGLLVDGHGSRFQLDFLSYINNTTEEGTPLPDVNHRWNCFIGLPNATALWQVGDSSEQNGQFKENLRVFAHAVRDQQRRDMTSIKLRKTDIIPMIMSAYHKSFGHTPNNKKAIAKRGWNPLNRACLLNAEVMDKKGEHRYPSEDELDLEYMGNKDADDRPNIEDVTEVSLLNLRRQRRLCKSEWKMRAQPLSVNRISVSVPEVTDVVAAFAGSKRRVIAQEKEHLLNVKKRAKASANIEYEMDVTKKIGAGVLARTVGYSLNVPCLHKGVRVKKEMADDAAQSKRMATYKRKKAVWDTAMEVKKATDGAPVKPKDIVVMIKFKQLNLELNPKAGGIKKEKTPSSVTTIKMLWNKVKKYPDPDAPGKPYGYDEYMSSKERVNECQDI